MKTIKNKDFRYELLHVFGFKIQFFLIGHRRIFAEAFERKKRSMDLSNQKEVKEVNKTQNTSTEKEILRVLQARHHFPQPTISCAICKSKDCVKSIF